MTEIRNLKVAERFEAVAPHAGHWCNVTFGKWSTSTVEAIVIGASAPYTNGNSTGDLIIQALPGRQFRVTVAGNDVVTRMASVALAQIHQIERLKPNRPGDPDANAWGNCSSCGKPIHYRAKSDDRFDRDWFHDDGTSDHHPHPGFFAVGPEAADEPLESCGCPAAVVADEGHQEGCTHG